MADGISFDYLDANAPAHERKWHVEGDVAGGVNVVALDDHDVEFDRVRLRRHGAFIVLETPQGAPIPQGFTFLKPIIEARQRAELIGLEISAWPPVLVHSEHIRRTFELGYAPGIERPPARGKAEFFGIRVVWDETLDYMTL